MKFTSYVIFDNDIYYLGKFNSTKTAKLNILKLHVEKKIFLRYHQIINYYDNGELDKIFKNEKEAMMILNKGNKMSFKYKNFPYHLLKLDLDQLRNKFLFVYQKKKYFYIIKKIKK